MPKTFKQNWNGGPHGQSHGGSSMLLHGLIHAWGMWWMATLFGRNVLLRVKTSSTWNTWINFRTAATVWIKIQTTLLCMPGERPRGMGHDMLDMGPGTCMTFIQLLKTSDLSTYRYLFPMRWYGRMISICLYIASRIGDSFKKHQDWLLKDWVNIFAPEFRKNDTTHCRLIVLSTMCVYCVHHNITASKHSIYTHNDTMHAVHCMQHNRNHNHMHIDLHTYVSTQTQGYVTTSELMGLL